MSDLTTGQRAVIGVVVLGAVSVGIWATLQYYAAPPAPTLKYPEITAAILARVDTDGDGRVSAAEYGKVGLEDVPLATFDVDRDGSLSAVEVEASFLKESPSTLLRTHAPPGSPLARP